MLFLIFCITPIFALIGIVCLLVGAIIKTKIKKKLLLCGGIILLLTILYSIEYMAYAKPLLSGAAVELKNGWAALKQYYDY